MKQMLLSNCYIWLDARHMNIIANDDHQDSSRVVCVGFHCLVLLPETCIVSSYCEVEGLSYSIMARVVL